MLGGGKPWPLWARVGVVALALNEVRGIITVALTAPVWWPAITAMFHAAMGR